MFQVIRFGTPALPKLHIGSTLKSPFCIRALPAYSNSGHVILR